MTDAVIAYLDAQRQAGAQALQVFDTWGGVLSPAMYREFSLRYLQRIAQALPRGEGHAPEERTPLILFGKGNGAYLEELADTGAEGVGVDWTVSLGDAARRTGGRVALQGNLDPVTLYAQPDAIRREVGRALDDYAARQRRFARRPCVQPRPRHVARHEPGPRRRAGRGGARAQRALSPASLSRCARPRPAADRPASRRSPACEGSPGSPPRWPAVRLPRRRAR